MPLVDQDKVIAEERLDVEGLLLALLAQLRDLDDLDCLVVEEPARAFLENLRLDPRLLELLQVLSAQALARCE